jgi:hypothetical protein
MEFDRVRFLPDIKILVLYNLRFLLGDYLLCILPGRSNRFPYPLTLEPEINIPVFTTLLDCHSFHLLLFD